MDRHSASGDEVIEFFEGKGFKPLPTDNPGIAHLTRDPDGKAWIDAVSIYRGQTLIRRDVIDLYLRKTGFPPEEFWRESSA